MALNIPVPKTFMQSFLDTRKQGVAEDLARAQAQQARGAASKSNMLAQLMGEAFGTGTEGSGTPSQPSMGQPGGQPEGQPEQQPPGGQPSMGGGGQPFSNQPNPRQARAREILQMLGYLKETPGQQEQREIRTAMAKEWGGADVKASEDWNKTITAAHESMPNLENVQEISANPVFQNMYKNPEYFGKDIQWLTRFGKPEEIKLLTAMDTNVKDLYKATASDFKGAFREFEKKLFDAALPDKRDTLAAIQSKTNTIMALRKIVSDRLSLAQNILRSSGGQITPSAALDIADRQIGTKQIVKQVEDRFKQSEKSQKAAYQKEHPSAPSNAPGEADIVMMERPDGKVVRVHTSNVQKAMEQYKFKRVGQNG